MPVRPDSSVDSDGWIPLGDSAADITWSPLKVDRANDSITNILCGQWFGTCVPEWVEDNGVTTARVPLAVNVTLKFQASGVRVFGSAGVVAGTNPESVVAIGLAVIDGKTGEGQAARFLETGEGDAAQPVFVQKNLDPRVQHTLFMDFANSPSATVPISNFEIFRGLPPTHTSSTGSGSPVEPAGGSASLVTGSPATAPAQGTGASPSVPKHSGERLV